MADLQSKPLIELNLDTREITITNNIKYIENQLNSSLPKSKSLPVMPRVVS